MSDLETSTDEDTQAVDGGALAEFAELNRRRVFGSPPLSLVELARWQLLRESLDRRFGKSCQGDESWKGVERRDHLRLSSHICVEWAGKSGGVVLDISQGGMFLATDQPLQLGAKLVVELLLPDRAENLELSGTVVRSTIGRKPSGPCGMGVVFTGLDPARRAALADLVEELAGSN